MQSVFTVGPDNKAQARNIVTGDRVGDGWIVTQGPEAGRQSHRRGCTESAARGPRSADPLQSEVDDGSRGGREANRWHIFLSIVRYSRSSSRIVIVILGCVVIPTLPIATYPEVVPPVVQITAVYQGGNATDLEKTVSQPIEQQLTGLDGMLYYFARASNNGTLTIDVTFELGTDPDLATVKVQNKVSVALPLLPPEVQRVGVTTKKVSSSFLLFVALTAPDNRYDTLFLNNYAAINLVDKIGSLPGVGNSVLAGAAELQHARLGQPGQDGEAGAYRDRHQQRDPGAEQAESGGFFGTAPGPSGARLSIPSECLGSTDTPQEFGDIVVRAQPDGSLLRVRDIGNVQLGAQDYSNFTSWNRRDAAFIIVYLAPGANAVETQRQVVKLHAAGKADISGRPRIRIPLRLHPLRDDFNFRSDQDAVCGHRAGHLRRIHFSSELAGDAHSVAHGSGRRYRYVCSVSRSRVFHQHHQLVRFGARDRHCRRRRHCCRRGGPAQHRPRHESARCNHSRSPGSIRAR